MITVILISIACIAFFFLVIILMDDNRFVIREYSISDKRISREKKIVVLADLHNKQYGKENEKLLLAVKKENPDFIMTAGDMITAKKGKNCEAALKLMQKLSKEYPVCYGIGNHEYRMKIYTEDYGNQYEQYTKQLKEQHIEVLENDKVSFTEDNIDVYGAMIEREYYKRFHTNIMREDYIEGLIGQADKNHFTILLAHNPDYFKKYADWGADLVLSGHVHGGIMRLPFLGGVVSPKCTLFPKYDGGIYQSGKSMMVLSRGLGTHTIPIRIFNPGELVVIHLKPCKS